MFSTFRLLSQVFFAVIVAPIFPYYSGQAISSSPNIQVADQVTFQVPPVEKILEDNPHQVTITVEPSNHDKEIALEREKTVSTAQLSTAESKAVISRVASELGYNVSAALCIAEHESTFNNRAVSPSGKYNGLYQFDTPTWKEQFESKSYSVFNAEANARAAIRLLKAGEVGRWPQTTKMCGVGKVADSQMVLVSAVSIRVIARGSQYGNCYAYVKRMKPSLPHTLDGWARSIPVNSHTPQVGAAVVTWESSSRLRIKSGHVALVVGITPTSIIIQEANYIHNALTQRSLPINSKLIKGYVL